jgi:L-2,3-diaminopropanoate---citrate ligase
MSTLTTGATEALRRARAAARERLLNATVRELGPAPAGPGPWRLELLSGGALVADVDHWSPSGHHRWADEVLLETDGSRRPVGDDEFVDLLLSVIDSAVDETRPDRVAALAEQVRNSVARTARYLAAPERPEPEDAPGRTRHAEQALVFGHPFHPVPKSVQGVAPADADRFAPELGTSFRLHHLALHPDVAVEQRVAPGAWTPDDVAAHAPDGWPVVPVHPWQMTYLRERPAVAALLADGRLRDLGPLGRPVYPTSSVRTVCDPTSETAWKLPLHLRITNFVRTIPPEHARRAADASALVAALREQWDVPGFEVLLETGWRGIDPTVVGDPDGEGEAADLIAVYRENPFAAPAAPRVLAGLLEPGPRGEEPMLVRDLRAAGADPEDWLRAYLRISLAPLLEIFGTHGLGFEAHLQNSLLDTDAHGLPARFWVRDMEGAHVGRERAPASLDARSPLLYDDEEAWQRLRYHAVVNQLASVVATLGASLPPGETAFWGVVAEVLADVRGPGAPWADDLLRSPTLPAKANLLSRFAERGEHPLYVDLPNPIRRAAG